MFSAGLCRTSAARPRLGRCVPPCCRTRRVASVPRPATRWRESVVTSGCPCRWRRRILALGRAVDRAPTRLGPQRAHGGGRARPLAAAGRPSGGRRDRPGHRSRAAARTAAARSAGTPTGAPSRRLRRGGGRPCHVAAAHVARPRRGADPARPGGGRRLGAAGRRRRGVPRGAGRGRGRPARGAAGAPRGVPAGPAVPVSSRVAPQGGSGDGRTAGAAGERGGVGRTGAVARRARPGLPGRAAGGGVPGCGPRRSEPAASRRGAVHGPAPRRVASPLLRGGAGLPAPGGRGRGCAGGAATAGTGAAGTAGGADRAPEERSLALLAPVGGADRPADEHAGC